MTQETLLALLKTDLQISVSDTIYDTLLQGYIEEAQHDLEVRGIEIDPTSTADNTLVMQCAAAEYRMKNNNEEQPKWLKEKIKRREIQRATRPEGF